MFSVWLAQSLGHMPPHVLMPNYMQNFRTHFGLFVNPKVKTQHICTVCKSILGDIAYLCGIVVSKYAVKIRNENETTKPIHLFMLLCHGITHLQFLFNLCSSIRPKLQYIMPHRQLSISIWVRTEATASVVANSLAAEPAANPFECCCLLRTKSFFFCTCAPNASTFINIKQIQSTSGIRSTHNST